MGKTARQRAFQLFAGLIVGAAIVLPQIANSAPVVIVAFGDSETFGSGQAPSRRSGGVPVAEAYPAKLEQALRARGWDVAVNNQGVPGRTAGSGVSLADQLPPANLVIVQLGANDRYAGVAPATIAGYLTTIVGKLRAKGSATVLAQNWPPPEESLYLGARQSANETVALIEGLYPGGVPPLSPVLPQYDSGDGLHLNAAGTDVVVARLLPAVERVLVRSGFRPGQGSR
jgi:acyl-CoA thioesterase-1